MTPASDVPAVTLPSGEPIPALGLGTWQMAERPSRRAEEIDALRAGLDLGMTLIDTAEMYAHGGAETLVGEAIAGRRDGVFLVSKVLPSHATRPATITACQDSLVRLGTDRIDLYLLHWPAPTPLEETVAAFEELVTAGKIRYWGVSNFDTAGMATLFDIPQGPAVATNQVLYNLKRRSIEWDLLPALAARHIPVMAYSPIEQGRLLNHRAIRSVADRHGATAAQVALAWVLRHDGMTAIPKAGTVDHVRQNRGALDLELTDEDLAALDRAFPPPQGPRPLDLL